MFPLEVHMVGLMTESGWAFEIHPCVLIKYKSRMRVSLLIWEADSSLLDSIRYFQGCDAHVKAAGILLPVPETVDRFQWQ